eukprot:2555437-Amphidinium_carterae.1
MCADVEMSSNNVTCMKSESSFTTGACFYCQPLLAEQQSNDRSATFQCSSHKEPLAKSLEPNGEHLHRKATLDAWDCFAFVLLYCEMPKN